MTIQAGTHEIPEQVAPRRDPWPALLMLGALALWLFVVATYIIPLPDSVPAADPPTPSSLMPLH
jgi:hypothetical protein